MTTDQARADELYALADEIALVAKDDFLSAHAASAIESLAETFEKAARLWGERSCKYCHAIPGANHAHGCIARPGIRVFERRTA